MCFKELNPVAYFEDVEIAKNCDVNQIPDKTYGASCCSFSENDDLYEIYGNSMYIFGGSDEDADVSDRFSAFNFGRLLQVYSHYTHIFFYLMCLFFKIDTHQWTTVEVLEGHKPSARTFHSAVIYDGSMWLFGGRVC
jgi:hypothetical protein